MLVETFIDLLRLKTQIVQLKVLTVDCHMPTIFHYLCNSKLRRIKIKKYVSSRISKTNACRFNQRRF